MKIKAALTYLGLLLLTLSPLQAENIAFPEEGDPYLTLNIPDGWEPAFDEDGTLSAADPDDEVQVVMWELTSEEDLKNIGTDVDGIISEYATDIKTSDKPEEMTINDLTCFVYKGVGKEKEGDRSIGFEVLIIKVDEGKAVVLYLDYYEDAEKELIDNLIKIVSTVKAIK